MFHSDISGLRKILSGMHLYFHVVFPLQDWEKLTLPEQQGFIAMGESNMKTPMQVTTQSTVKSEKRKKVGEK